ncbi:MAG: hypothetical protein A3D24_02875 [Candidatus Blackburnbacteria bacterium RIFCSPHIGHO2_02_FULL_39_13]|uniref:Nucleotidyl transferase AbiEii/AbiGii toxin family protein n=1 Tax=Candidatus Blackburnbacteria bacterium RIFCSPLOWO2_01_FULL_40_20 TaxID=1797519 RepID=A0A1G1VBU2_9BACT|nr:MAG: hypothetical protein A2694_01780 [Candidatus Blackburnbacteria bacterium RIFCSPHIGHO2_01_FULL_40_17]OGY07767.1 MAG: hypothetical protein A3D24_02875 [Candidatus Blackburnbacteria bacterium RIFCSPHIGHO2_02_FULL_39_13]OGY12826.1 MAG: hypothetical protein A3A77_03040 [Candidatus Blackburnbacteria bacterium RIFCSPLOWO2_01_FULL_40_20]
MGKVRELTDKQLLIFREIANDVFFRSQFYFSGGTALASVYLHHRVSDDLDFFSQNKFDPLILLNKVSSWSIKHDFKFSPQTIEDTHVFNMSFPDRYLLKVDFAYYPYKRLKVGEIFEGMETDSLEDIAASKMMLINQRSEVKDFVDLYFLLNKFSVWDLLIMAEAKFGVKLDILNQSADFLKVEEFEFLPRMIKPLTIAQLKDFFRNLAKEMGSNVVEK